MGAPGPLIPAPKTHHPMCEEAHLIHFMRTMKMRNVDNKKYLHDIVLMSTSKTDAERQITQLADATHIELRRQIIHRRIDSAPLRRALQKMRKHVNSGRIHFDDPDYVWAYRTLVEGMSETDIARMLSDKASDRDMVTLKNSQIKKL